LPRDDLEPRLENSQRKDHGIRALFLVDEWNAIQSQTEQLLFLRKFVENEISKASPRKTSRIYLIFQKDKGGKYGAK
jgi:hypothetical protein